MAKQKMTEDQLLAQIENLERQAIGYYGGEIASEQATAMDYYLGKPLGTEEEGRSSVSSSDVWDVVEGLTPMVLKPFVSSEDVVKFNPVGPEDEESAQQESDYVNHVVTQRNDVFEVLVAWVKTGLLQKNGVVKYWWETSTRAEIERYDGLDDDQFTMLIEAENVTVMEHTETQVDDGMGGVALMHDVVIRVSQEVGEPRFAVVPPEEFLISRDATTPNPKHANFVQHACRKTISQLREMGYDVEDDLADDIGDDPFMSEQYNARMKADEDQSSYDDSYDPAMREVVFRESFMLVDFDGDGIAELRKVCRVGKKVLANEETEEIPFCAWTPYQQPFKFYGRCPADETVEIQLIKTTLWRQSMDNIYTINNNRNFVSNKVNLDDLLDNQIAGIVRVDGDVVGNHVMPAPVTPIGGVIQPMIEYLDSAKENRTGFTRYNQGTDSNSLNKTATGVRIIAEAGNQRVDIISRSFAEQGLKNLMLGVHGLIRRHGSKQETMRLRGKWVTVDPRNWKTRLDMTVSVGLGTADKQMQLQGAQMLMNEQKQLVQAGIVTPQNLLHGASKLVEAIGYKNPEAWFSEPQEQAPPDPTQSPEFMLKMRELDLREKEIEIKDRDSLVNADVKEAEIALKAEAQGHNTELQIMTALADLQRQSEEMNMAMQQMMMQAQQQDHDQGMQMMEAQQPEVIDGQA